MEGDPSGTAAPPAGRGAGGGGGGRGGGGGGVPWGKRRRGADSESAAPPVDDGPSTPVMDMFRGFRNRMDALVRPAAAWVAVGCV